MLSTEENKNVSNLADNESGENATTSMSATAAKDEADQGKKNPETQDTEQTPKLEDKDKTDDSDEESFHFFPIETMEFKMTPERNREMHRFRQILNSPYMNVPLLVVRRQEDVFPLLSLYIRDEARKDRSVSFFSVTPSDFGMDFDASDYSYDLNKKLDLGATIIEFGEKKSIPVYCDLADYRDRDVLGKFVGNFLKKEMPAVLVARESEMNDLREDILADRNISGGLELPETPYVPHGLARASELKISPLTAEEKQVYFSHYMQKIFLDHNLTCSRGVRNHLIRQAIKRSSHDQIFFKVFEMVNQIVVMTKASDKKGVVSHATVTKALDQVLPVHDRTKALMDLDVRLKKKIYGQDQAIDTSYEAILSNLDDERRDKPTVLGFFGPSGVGKTALAEEISLAMTGKPVATINMAEYADSFKASILIGSSKGYVDSDEDGLLAKIVKENPRAVLLLDEFEKAHLQVQQTFMGIFDKGSVNDNHAGQIDMSQTTIILTSNAGVRSEKSLGFGAPSTPSYVADRDLIQDSFPPELLGRIDAKILFHPLNDEALNKVVSKFMNMLEPRFKQLGVQVVLSPAARQELVTKAKDPSAGARPLLALIRQKIKTPIEIGVLKNRIHKGDRIIINAVEKKEMHIVPAGRKRGYRPDSEHVY